MAKVNKLWRKNDSKYSKATRYLLPSTSWKVRKHVRPKRKCNKVSEKKDWEDATCSVCLEFPHNAVLLLCSSYNKGCRPYMCATSHRYSNCLEQYKKAYTKVASTENSEQWTWSMGDLDSSSLAAGEPGEKTEVSELLCPLCRGQVKGWTVVEPARKYLNTKKRSCMQEKCTFVGNYKELRKHVKAKHPLARPRAVDPILEEKWKRLECERERSDVISTIISSTPGAVVLGDYVLEPNQNDFYSDFDSDIDDDMEDVNLESYLGRNVSLFSRSMFRGDDDPVDEDSFRARQPQLLGFIGPRSGLHRTRITFSRGRWRGRGAHSGR